MARTRSPLQSKVYNGPFPLQNDKDFLSLNARQQKFVYNIFLQPTSHWSNTKCYQDAYQNPNYNTSAVEAHRLLKHPKVIACVSRLRAAYYEMLNVTPDRVLDELGVIAFSDLSDYFDDNGDLTVHPSQLPARARRAISGFQVINNLDGSKSYKVTLWNKSDGLKQLRQMLAMDKPSPQRIEVSGPGGGPIRTTVDINHKIDFTGLDKDEVMALYSIISKLEKKDESGRDE